MSLLETIIDIHSEKPVTQKEILMTGSAKDILTWYESNHAKIRKAVQDFIDKQKSDLPKERLEILQNVLDMTKEDVD